MGFRRMAPQVFENTEGYIVQMGGRTTMEYIEGLRKAVVEVEFGVGSTCIYVHRIAGWIMERGQMPMTDEERRIVIERVSAALQFDGSAVETSTG